MGVDDFTNGNVDHWFGEGHKIRVLVHIKFILKLWDITSTLEKPSGNKHKSQTSIGDACVRRWHADIPQTSATMLSETHPHP